MNIIKVLFIVDGSLSNPILFSQGIPHIQENSKKGIKFYIISFEDFKILRQNPEINDRYVQAINELKEYAEIFSIPINFQMRLSSLRIFINGILKSFKLIKTYKIDLIHGRSSLPSMIGVTLKWFFNIKVLNDNRGLVSDELNNKLRIYIELFLEKQILKKSDAIVVVSNALKNIYLNNILT